MNEKIMVVTGSTGNQGGAVADRLLADGWRVRALTRDVTSSAAVALARRGADVVAGSVADPASLAAAFVGAHGVFSVQPSALGPDPVPPEQEYQWGRAVADAAHAAGIAHLVYASVAGADRARHVGPFYSKWRVEQHIAEIGVPFTVLRPASFMENYVNPAFGVGTGALPTALRPDAPEQLVALRDVGSVAALAFAHPADHLGRTIPLAGDALTPPQVAEALTRSSGRDIVHVPVPLEAVRAQSPDAAAAIAFLNTEGYGVDVPATRHLYPFLLDFPTWLAHHGRPLLTALFNQPLHPAT